MSENRPAPETEIFEDEIEIPEDAAKARPVTKRRTSRLGLYLTTALGAVVAGAFAFNTMGGQDLLDSQFAKAPRSMDDTPAGAQLATSERYRETLTQVNFEGAQAATATRELSFIPAPDQPVGMRDIDEPVAAPKVRKPKLPAANTVVKAPQVEPQIVEKIVEVPVEVEVERRVEVPVEKPVYYEVQDANAGKIDDYSDIDALTNMMNGALNGLGIETGTARNEVVIEQDFGVPDGTGRQSRPRPIGLPDDSPRPNEFDRRSPQGEAIGNAGTYGADPLLGADFLVPQEKKLPVRTGTFPKSFNPYGFGPGGVFGVTPTAPGGILAKAGDVSYAYLVNGTDTDTPGPLIAEITSGDLKGARLIGSFSANRETTGMIVSFDRVVLESGENLPVTAYAVDPIYGDLAVRSRFDGRYVQRYAPKLAGAFLAGAGAAVAATGTTVVGLTDQTVGVASPEQNATEAIAAGVAGVGEQLAEEIENLGPDGPLVSLFAGKPLGVLYLSNVVAPQ